MNSKNYFIPRECEEKAIDEAKKKCYWINKQPRLIKYTDEYAEAITDQLRIYYSEDIYNLFDDGNVENNLK